MIKEAWLSPCRKFRYRLNRIWDESLPRVTFIMLNPSTADEWEDDPTIRRCIGFAKSWGYGGIQVCNLFPYRATNPKELLTAENPCHPTMEFSLRNDVFIEEAIQESDKVIYAWGNGTLIDKVLNKFPDYSPLPHLVQRAHYLALCKDGTPGHPLYLKGDLQPQPVKGIQQGLKFTE